MQRKWKIGSEASNVCAIDSNVHPIDSIRSSKTRNVNSEASNVFSIDGIVYLEASNVSSEIDKRCSICSTICSNIEPKCTNIDT